MSGSIAEAIKFDIIQFKALWKWCEWMKMDWAQRNSLISVQVWKKREWKVYMWYYQVCRSCQGKQSQAEVKVLLDDQMTQERSQRNPTHAQQVRDCPRVLILETDKIQQMRDNGTWRGLLQGAANKSRTHNYTDTRHAASIWACFSDIFQEGINQQRQGSASN